MDIAEEIQKIIDIKVAEKVTEETGSIKAYRKVLIEHISVLKDAIKKSTKDSKDFIGCSYSDIIVTAEGFREGLEYSLTQLEQNIKYNTSIELDDR